MFGLLNRVALRHVVMNLEGGGGGGGGGGAPAATVAAGPTSATTTPATPSTGPPPAAAAPAPPKNINESFARMQNDPRVAALRGGQPQQPGAAAQPQIPQGTQPAPTMPASTTTTSPSTPAADGPPAWYVQQQRDQQRFQAQQNQMFLQAFQQLAPKPPPPPAPPPSGPETWMEDFARPTQKHGEAPEVYADRVRTAAFVHYERKREEHTMTQVKAFYAEQQKQAQQQQQQHFQQQQRQQGIAGAVAKGGFEAGSQAHYLVSNAVDHLMQQAEQRGYARGWGPQQRAMAYDRAVEAVKKSLGIGVIQPPVPVPGQPPQLQLVPQPAAQQTTPENPRSFLPTVINAPQQQQMPQPSPISPAVSTTTNPTTTPAGLAPPKNINEAFDRMRNDPRARALAR